MNTTKLMLEPGTIRVLLPMIATVLAAFVVLLWDVLLKPRDKGVLSGTAFIGATAATVSCAALWPEVAGGITHSFFGGHLVLDGFGVGIATLCSFVATAVVVVSRSYVQREEVEVGEYYALILFALTGMIVVALAADLAMLFVGIELMSIPVYVLVAFNRSDYKCIESALKYFVLGSFGAGILLYGMSLTYAATGTLDLASIVGVSGSLKPLLLLGAGLMVVGLAFKVAVVPFHGWSPDVYEGAPTPITLWMATAVKVAAFAATVRVVVALEPLRAVLEPVILVIALVTVVVGNVGALRQKNLKRLLAYSSIAHSGYMFAGLLLILKGQSGDAMKALLYYLVAYSLTSVGLFTVIIMFGQKEREPVEMEHWSGMGFKYPGLGAALSLFLLSLAGLPPTAGFVGKFWLFSALVGAGYTGTVIVAVLAAVVSFGYYLRVVVYMYMHESTGEWRASTVPMASIVVGAMAVLVLWLGVLPPVGTGLFDILQTALVP